MESRRLVVWISTGILGFQGVTLCFDLLNCTALSWVYVRSVGFQASVPKVQVPAVTPNGSGGTPPAAAPTPNPLNLFCERPPARVSHQSHQLSSRRKGRLNPVLTFPWHKTA